MKNNKFTSNKGVTLVALIITIVVLLIILSVTWIDSDNTVNETRIKTQFNELKMVQGAILQINAKHGLTGVTLLGTKYTSLEDIEIITNEIEKKTGRRLTLKDTNPENYYLITKTELEEMGIRQIDEEFIVNYTTGEVINKTKKVTKDKQALYIYSVE